VSVDVDRLSDLEPTSARALAEAEALAARGDLLDAIDLLQGTSYAERDPLVDVRLAELRRDAFPILHAQPATPWPLEFEDPFPGETNLIDLPRSEATPEVVGGAIRHHGCILVRGLLDPDVAGRLVGLIERSFTALEAANEGASPEQTSPWYKPLEPHPDFPPNLYNQIEERANLRWFRVCTLDSPRTMFEVIDAYEKAGIGDIVRRYLGARPVLTGGKWALRRMPKRKISGWHQEASVFPKVPIRTMNVWLALTPCGDDSPSLDVVPRREAVVHPVGKNFMMVPEQVESITAGAPKVSPRYEPGDAMLFDEMLIHRTNTAKTMESVRYSIESWFFAPSGHPLELGPIVF
jgi:hypothetical protein